MNLLLAQEVKTMDEHQENGVYLRIANLLPLSREAIDIHLNREPLLLGLTSGMVMHYIPADKQGGQLGITLAGQQLSRHSVKSERENKDEFYTLVIFADEGVIQTKLLQDHIEPKENADTNHQSGVDYRIRLYLGGYDFPVKCEVAKQNWSLDGQAMVGEEIIILDPTLLNKGASIICQDKHDRESILRGPLVFGQSNQLSVFVSQRGKRRLRLEVFPDCVKPPEEAE
ncbi:MAG: hypothetical protein AAGA18_13015 [Verrucomicrobiota bacterium]